MACDVVQREHGTDPHFTRAPVCPPTSALGRIDAPPRANQCWKVGKAFGHRHGGNLSHPWWGGPTPRSHRSPVPVARLSKPGVGPRCARLGKPGHEVEVGSETDVGGLAGGVVSSAVGVVRPMGRLARSAVHVVRRSAQVIRSASEVVRWAKGVVPSAKRHTFLAKGLVLLPKRLVLLTMQVVLLAKGLVLLARRLVLLPKGPGLFGRTGRGVGVLRRRISLDGPIPRQKPGFYPDATTKPPHRRHLHACGASGAWHRSPLHPVPTGLPAYLGSWQHRRPAAGKPVLEGGEIARPSALI
jgi:hypothetical protein